MADIDFNMLCAPILLLPNPAVTGRDWQGAVKRIYVFLANRRQPVPRLAQLLSE
jgi:hypothetical protein